MNIKDLENRNKELIEEVEKLKRKVSILKTKKKYGLVWDEEKEPEQIVLDCQYKIPILKEDETKKIILDKEKQVNILIEGDNYHALSVLNYTHKGKIDVIYIDPPYNTGAKDWKYNNNYVIEEDGYRHSKWLNMMNKRLELAKNLLSGNGVLICAIDENELANLYLLLYKIFCSNSRKFGYRTIDLITIIHNPSGTQSKNFSYCNEYALFVYPTNTKTISYEQRSEENADIRSFMNGAKGKDNNYLRITGYNCFYPILIKDNEIIGFGDVCDKNFHPQTSNIKRKDNVIEIYPIDNENVERKWLFARNSVEDVKNELNVKVNKKTGFYEIFRIKSNINYKTVWNDKKYNAKIYGTQLVNEIINADFPFPKSLYNVEECLIATTKDNKQAIILDFFAGSGTTGHAVLELNKKDGGNRKFILCTNNENNICKEVTYPRIYNVMKGYKFKGKDKTTLYEKKITFSNLSKNFDELLEEINTIVKENEDKYDKIDKKFEDNIIKIIGIKNIDGFKDGLSGNLSYFKTELLDIDHISHVSDEQKIELTYKAGEMIALKEDTCEEMEKNNWWQIFTNTAETKYTAIYFKEDKTKLNELVIKLSKFKENIVLYIFSWGKNEYKNEWTEYKNIKVEDIPEPIIDVYKKINRLW